MKGMISFIIALGLLGSATAWAQSGPGFRGTPGRFQKPSPVVGRPTAGPGFDGVFYQNNRFFQGTPGVGTNGSQPEFFQNEAPTVFPDPRLAEPAPIGFEN